MKTAHLFPTMVIGSLPRPRWVLEQMLRIGRRVIVSFPNFGHWRIRFQLLSRGRMPITDKLNDTWYGTPNIHFCSLTDFVRLCNALNIAIERRIYVTSQGKAGVFSGQSLLANFFGEQGIFLLKGNG